MQARTTLAVALLLLCGFVLGALITPALPFEKAARIPSIRMNPDGSADVDLGARAPNGRVSGWLRLGYAK